MSTDQRAQILQSIDLVELVSQTVALKRLGSRFKGLCPFHQEKTPSFTVDPAKGYFYCFGCKASGTAFDFVMKRDRVEFREALEILAQKAGIELIRERSGSKAPAGERQALLEAHSAACRFFENLLWHPQHGATARDYLVKRGFTEETLKRFQVGLAAESWDALLKGPVGRKFTPQLLHTAGLAKARDKGDGFYDTFRNRIMFPIRSEAGQIIAFGGRVLPGGKDPAKYLNSPETPLFSKSKSIFGLDLGRQRIVETRTVAVVEGYTDVVMAHQFGASNVVSVLGTAMTAQHVAILKRFADRIVLLFDSDSAGDAAVDRALQLFLTQEVEIAVASLPDGLDPDEYLLKHGLAAFDQLLAGATSALEYAWKQTRHKFIASHGDVTGLQKAADEYLDLLAGARASGSVDPMRWGLAVTGVSKWTGVPVAELHRMFANRKPRATRSPDGAAQPKQPETPAETANWSQRPKFDANRYPGRGGKWFRPRDPWEEIKARIAEQKGRVRPSLSARDLSEQWILGFVLIEPKHWHRLQLHLQPADFEDPPRRALAQLIWDHQRDEGDIVFKEFLAGIGEEPLRLLAIQLAEQVEQLSDSQVDPQVTLQSAIEHLAEIRRKRQEQVLLAGDSRPMDEVALLKQLQEKARQPDMRRVGQ